MHREPVPHHISILFEGQCRRYLDTFNNHYDQQKGFLGDLNQVFFNRPLASSVGVKDGTLVSGAVTLVHPNGFLRTKARLFKIDGLSLKPVLNWANVCSPNILRTN